MELDLDEGERGSTMKMEASDGSCFTKKRAAAFFATKEEWE